MFDNLTERLSRAAKNLSGKGRITDANIKDTMRQVRLALLEADRCPSRSSKLSSNGFANGR